jgi:hypothetical protein
MRLRQLETLVRQRDENAEIDCFIALTPNEVIVEEYNFGQPRESDR